MSILNREKFLAELANCTKNEGFIDLPKEILDGRPDFLFVVDELINHKLTVSELNQSYLFLARLLIGKYPKIAFTVQKADRIRLSYVAIGQLPATKGKLSTQEKLLFAFCVFHSVCVETYDENVGKIGKGINDIDSPSHALQLLKWEMKNHPEKFKFLSSVKQATSAELSVKKPEENINGADIPHAAESYTENQKNIQSEDVLPESKNKGDIDLPEEILHIEPDILFALNELLNHKLTVSELEEAYIYLAKLLHEKFPKIKFTVPKTDRLRLPYDALEQISITKGKLTRKEKLLFALSAFFYVCIDVYDEDNDTTDSGMKYVNYPLHLEQILDWEMENHPEKFNFVADETTEQIIEQPKKQTIEPPFAVSIENPVKAVSIADGYVYLNNLKTIEGNSVRYK